VRACPKTRPKRTLPTTSTFVRNRWSRSVRVIKGTLKGRGLSRSSERTLRQPVIASPWAQEDEMNHRLFEELHVLSAVATESRQ
jgi:hypothetical protein